MFDLEYDEIDYLKRTNLDSRLVAQLGRADVPSDANGLKLAADLKDTKPLMIKARDYLTKEVANVLKSLRRQVPNTTFEEELDLLLDISTGVLITQYNNADQAIEDWDNQYVQILQYAYNQQNNIGVNSWNDDWDKVDYAESFTNALELGIQEIRDYFADMDTAT